MKVCFVVLHHDTIHLDPASYLDARPVHRFLPEGVAACGHDVSLVHLFPLDAHLREGRVDFYFVAESRLVREAARLASRGLRQPPARFEPAIRTLRRVRALDPDVVHVHGVDLHLNLALLRARVQAPLVMHYHGGYPSARPFARALQRFNLAGIDRYLFTTEAHAAPFIETGLIRRDDVIPFVELSSPFVMRPRPACREETGMVGRPVFVWTGRLHPIKDPLTALAGFERILEAWPNATLYMYYRTADLLPEVQSFLDARPAVRGRVHLRGRVRFEEMEAVYNSADFLLQASRREFSGCAVLEALSCGTLPVVTDIPSFRAITDEGRHGLLFPVGDAEALAGRVLEIIPTSVPQRARAARAYFETTLSFGALAGQLERVYRDVTSGSRS